MLEIARAAGEYEVSRLRSRQGPRASHHGSSVFPEGKAAPLARLLFLPPSRPAKASLSSAVSFLLGPRQCHRLVRGTRKRPRDDAKQVCTLSTWLMRLRSRNSSLPPFRLSLGFSLRSADQGEQLLLVFLDDRRQVRVRDEGRMLLPGFEDRCQDDEELELFLENLLDRYFPVVPYPMARFPA
ncbi:hypothetical protein KM043_009329 [Ampulex compressa]|nr:hypothetical protein KM043_009329 [Ampulex compressa]